MEEHKNTLRLTSLGTIIILGAIVKFGLHLYSSPEYGFFGDELYTIAMSRHLALGYVDLPPLVPALAALSRMLLGDSLFSYHVFPALAGAATLVFIGLITKEFGGKAFAVLISVLGFISVPIWLGLNSIFCYDGFDQLVLAGFLYVVVRFLKSGDRRLWLLLGLIAGIASLTKMTILFLGPGFLIALLISNYRKELLTPWPWLGAIIFVFVVSPYLVWQNTNGWPTLEYWSNYSTIRMGDRPPVLEFLTGILFTAGPLMLPLWMAGLYRLFRRLNGFHYVFFGILFLATAVTLYIRNGQTRMLIELYLPLMAAGAVLVEELISKVGRGVWIKVVVIVYILIAGIDAVLTELPILPLEKIETYRQASKFFHPPYQEFGQTFYASPILSGKRDWEKLAQEVANVFNELPPEDQAVAGIWADWYGPAAAIDYYAPRLGIPHAVTGHLTYYLWGPGYSWDVMVVITNSSLTSFFAKCDWVTEIHHPYIYVGSPNIFICREPKLPVDEIWVQLKAYR
jgi:hypothetical protein